MEEDVRYEIEFRIALTDGKERVIHGVGQVERDNEGKPLFMRGTGQDITEQKGAEAALRETQEQFQQAQKLESIGRLAGGVAHDFNNILCVILGYGEGLVEQLHHGDPLREDAEQIVEAARRSAELTRQLLAFSRKQALQPRVLDLNTVIRNIETMLGRLIGEDIELVLSLSENLAQVMADPGQIEQAIMNLTVNASDAMSLGGKLTIETTNVELDNKDTRDRAGLTPGKFVMLEIRDTGAGMDKDTAAHIFEPFFTTKADGKGTGLGLSMVYGIVKQSGGDILVYSEPDQGASFKIYLPRTELETQVHEDRSSVETISMDGENILVVEDEEYLRTLMVRMLSKFGYQVSVSANGGEALLLMEEEGLRPDLVITDVVMPGMSGSALIDRLRKNDPDLRVLYMSGYTDADIVHHGVLDADMPYIQKPFNINDIVSKVQEVLRSEGPTGT